MSRLEGAKFWIGAGLLGIAGLAAESVDVNKPNANVNTAYFTNALPTSMPQPERVPEEKPPIYIALRKDPMEELEEEMKKTGGNQNNGHPEPYYPSKSNGHIMRRPVPTRPV